MNPSNNKKPLMKKILLAAAVLAAVSTVTSRAAVGWFDDYVLVSIDGGSEQYYWIGSNPNFGTQFDGANFGSLTTLTFGVDMKYWASDGDTRDGGSIFVSINGGAATEYLWNHASIGGNDYQGLLPVTTIDVTAGLSEGSHTVAVWAKTWGTGGDSWLSNDGNNYTASFSVVPEPSTYALLALSAVAMGGYVVRRRRRA